jgi:hypothetical protein
MRSRLTATGSPQDALARARTESFSFRLAAATRRKLHRARSGSLALRIVATGAGGRRATIERTLTLRR